jgi:hypothetical protein
MKSKFLGVFNPIPTGHERNQPIYECHVTTDGRNRVNQGDIAKSSINKTTLMTKKGGMGTGLPPFPFGSDSLGAACRPGC